MSVQRKYVRFKKGIVIFPESVIHSEFASELRHLLGWPISAGFTDGETCWGESISIGVKSLPEDSDILQNGTYENGYDW
jgi:hypothetical protein